MIQKESSLVKLFWLAYLPVIFWMGVIFYLSNQPGVGGNSYNLIVYTERKIAHVGEYFILTLLLVRCGWLKNLRPARIIFSAMFVALLYAATDEWHQLYIPGREGKLTDVGIDFVGIVIAAVLVSFILRWKQSRVVLN